MADNNTPPSISDALRRTIEQAIADNRTNYLTLERETGVARASIRRFVNGERSLRLDVADQLAAFFGLTILEQEIRSCSPAPGRSEMFDNIVPVDMKQLRARYAFVFADEDERVIEQRGLRPVFERIRAWNAWKSRLRPLAILKPGLKAHLFNKGCRALVGLYEIENCSVFDFSRVTQFADEVKRVSGKGVLLQGHFTDEVERVSGKGVLLQENPASRKWSEIIEQRLKEKKGAPLHGYVFTARLLDCLDPCLRLSGKFPLHGWCDLQAPNFGMRT